MKKGDVQRYILGHRGTPKRVFYDPICSVDGCGREMKQVGMCGKHYDEDLRRRKGIPARWDGTTRNEDGHKRCSTCHSWKPEEDFAKMRGASDGLMSFCRACNAEVHRFKGKNAGIGRLREHYLKIQDNACAGCGLAFTGPGRRMDGPKIDHDHSCPHEHPTKYDYCEHCIRGVLCGWCNMALGLMQDDLDRFMGLMLYLIDWECRRTFGPVDTKGSGDYSSA